VFDPYLIVDGTLENVVEDGVTTGFAFQVRCGYYRRLIVSMVEELGVEVDGVAYPRSDVRFTLRGRTFTLDEMEEEYEFAWEFGEPALLTVLHPGGLPAGDHDVQLYERLRISYSIVPRDIVTTKTLSLAS
jgi:hypothetical protein